MTQHEMIRNYIDDYGHITPMEAYGYLGITKLSTRVGEMRRAGYNIDGEMVTGENRFGAKVRYMRYTWGA